MLRNSSRLQQNDRHSPDILKSIILGENILTNFIVFVLKRTIDDPTWIDIDRHLCRHMASLSHNELIPKKYKGGDPGTPIPTTNIWPSRPCNELFSKEDNPRLDKVQFKFDVGLAKLL